MRYFTWTEPAESARDPRVPRHPVPARPRAGRAGAPRERVLDEICCLEMT